MDRSRAGARGAFVPRVKNGTTRRYERVSGGGWRRGSPGAYQGWRELPRGAGEGRAGRAGGEGIPARGRAGGEREARERARFCEGSERWIGRTYARTHAYVWVYARMRGSCDACVRARAREKV